MDGLIETAGETGKGLVTRYRFDVDTYHRMGEAGILHEDDPIELIDGELIEMASVGGPHIGAVMALTHLLIPAAANGARVSVQSPVRLDRFNEPEPDVVLLRPRQDNYRGKSPPMAADVLLLVEVAQSSLRYDRGVKLPLYGRHGIPEVWIVDLDGRAVEICTGPNADGYTSITRAADTDVIAPTALPAARIVVADLMSTEK